MPNYWSLWGSVLSVLLAVSGGFGGRLGAVAAADGTVWMRMYYVWVGV